MQFSRLQFTVRGMMVAVVMTALAFCNPQLGTMLLIFSGAVFAVRSRLAASTAATSYHWSTAYLVSLASLYLPFAWVLGDYPWDDYRWHWIKLWPVLPGLVAGMLVHPNDYWVFLISGVVTVLLVLLLTVLGALSRRVLILTTAVTLIGSVLESCLAYQLFLF